MSNKFKAIIYTRNTSPLSKMQMKIIIILSFYSICLCESTVHHEDGKNDTAIISLTTNTTEPPQTTKSILKLLQSTTKTTKYVSKTTASFTTESTTRDTTTQTYTSTKGLVKTARWQKLNTTSSALGNTVHSSLRLQDRLGAVDCDLPVLPRESRLWRGNETHELNFPVTAFDAPVWSLLVSHRARPQVADRGFRRSNALQMEVIVTTTWTKTSKGGGEIEEDVECAAGHSEEDCPPFIVSWEGSADIQSGDILIVRITDPSLLEAYARIDAKNETTDANSSHVDDDRPRHRFLQPAVYQVTRQGHEHCDVSEGMLLDITPLDEQGAKLFTLYDKDLTEGVNLLIVVSAKWGSQCVRLKVTVKSDNCGESQECSGKGVCYTNVSMEGYECQCCPGYVGPHCEERDACNPSPCLNNGICVDLTQSLNGANYHCLCPYGFTGRKCERDPCFSDPCLNGGSCMSMAMNGSTTFHCACAEGWTGAHCDLPATGGPCDAKPCVKGICVKPIDNDIDDTKYRCFCEPGYTGKKCELEYNECESSPCANGGTCTDQVGGFSCACGRGYTGNMCQLKVDLCSPNPCSSQRYCIDHGNSYTCECPRGFIGEECHIPATSVCDNNPCAHGGTCWSGVDSFYCSCRPGYTGRLCEEDFILESVIDGESELDTEKGSSVREMHLPLGLYHDRLHNVFIAAGTLGAAITIVGVVVTACHCRVNKTYARLLSRLSRVREAGPPHHWLQDKRVPPAHPAAAHPPAPLDTTDMYYTLDFSDSQSSPLIQ